MSATEDSTARGANNRVAKARRAFWLKQVYSWHWISSAVCLVGMLLFAITGITLNNAAHLTAEPRVTELEESLPPELLQQIADLPKAGRAPLPTAVADRIRMVTGESTGVRGAELTESEIYLTFPRPGGDGWLSIDRASGDLLYERADRGWIAYLNDLHKGRNTGPVWSWFIDLFNAACLVFSATGLILLHTHAGRRPSTWPVVGIGLCVPLLLAMFFIH